jgi:hypothetical protein
MNSRFALLALSIAMAVLSLALVITAVGVTASSVSGEASGIEAGEVVRGGTDNRLLADQRPNISLDEPLTLTEPISIYLPLVSSARFIDKAVERVALMALYNSTNGDGWINSTGWGTEASFCEWYGVTCDEYGHVTVLDLDRNWLTGTLPLEIGNLPMLTVLRLTGTIICYGTPSPPPCDEKYYQLSGPLPPEIGNLVGLHEIDLSYNQLTSLPPEIGNLVSLQGLALYGNQLSSIPPVIGNLSSLQWLDLGYNQLTSLPPEIGNLASLLELDLESNQLASLPPDIGNLVNLQWLVLGYNQLTSLPSEIGNLASLQHLNLDFNQLKSLPPEIGNLVNLQGLRLDNNQLTSLPSEIGNLSSLLVLDLGYNQLSGAIPAFLSNLGNLWRLTLNDNPDLTCWETEEARDWAVSLGWYIGPTCFFP